MARLKCAVLVIGGSSDEHTTVDETRAMFAAAHDPRELWVVSGARHVDLMRFAGDEYRRRVGEFLAKHVSTGATPVAKRP